MPHRSGMSVTDIKENIGYKVKFMIILRRVQSFRAKLHKIDFFVRIFIFRVN